MKKKLNCVLLIDDDEPTNFLNTMVIEDADCAEQIQIVQSGEKALQYLTHSNGEKHEAANPTPDLIFLDINMPGMNGWEFLSKYKDIEKGNPGQVIVVMLTTSLNPDDKSKSTEIPQISGFETKPLTSEILDTILKKYFPENF